MILGVPSMQFIKNEEQRKLAGKMNFANMLLMRCSIQEDTKKCNTKELKSSCLES